MYAPSDEAIRRAVEMQEKAAEDVLAVDAVDYVASAKAGVTRSFDAHGSYQTGLPWRDDNDPY